MKNQTNSDSDDYNNVFYDSDKDPIYYYGYNLDDRNKYDENNYLHIQPEDSIDYRYEIIKRIGKGAFGKVYEAYDHKRNIPVALKCIRNERRFHKQVQLEVKFYQLMMNEEKMYSAHVIPMYKWFISYGDYFLIFELFGQDMYSYYKNNIIGNKDLQSFSLQIASGLEFIHSYGIIHMDLKPENILIKDKQLKIIDLGSSFMEEPNIMKDYVQSRYYRAPEVVFNTGLKKSMDIWSYGCIIYELAEGTPLIPAKSQSELVVYYTYIMDYPPTYMKKLYENDKYLLSKRQLKNGKTLIPKAFEWNHQNISLKQLINYGCLQWDPSKRLTSSEIIKHPYFQT